MTPRRPHFNDGDEDDDDSSGTRLYAILGLSKTATQAEVKAAFRAAARRLHPDRLLQSPSATKADEKTAAAAGDERASASSSSASLSGAAFAAAREAFLVLSDPIRREAYDASGTGGRSWYSRGGGGGGGGRGTATFWPAEAVAATATKEKKPTTSAFPSWTSDSATAPEAAARKRAQGGASSAAALLLAGLGHLRCDPRTQLVLTCALCSRPAGVSCSVCLLPLCALCCRRRHARAPGDSVGGRFVGASTGGHGSGGSSGGSSGGGSGGSSSSGSNGDKGSSLSALAFRPHWPLVDAPGSMSRRLAARELEAKRLADAALADAATPHARGRQELQDVRELRERYLAAAARGDRKREGGEGGAAFDAEVSGKPLSSSSLSSSSSSSSPSSRTTYDPFLSRFYAWDQTLSHVVVAVRLPTGDADRGLRVEVAESRPGDNCDGGSGKGERTLSSSSPSPASSRPTHRLFVAADGAPPVIDRVLSRAVAAAPAAAAAAAAAAPFLVRRSADNRALLLTIAKAVPGERWPRLFCGDSFGARCVDPPYYVREGSSSSSNSSSTGRGRNRRGENGSESDNDENADAPSVDDDGAVVEVELCPKLLPLPDWVERRHIVVETTREKLYVRVRGVFELERYFWDSTGRAVLPRETTWSLEKKKKKKKGRSPCGESESSRGKGSEEEKEAEEAKTTPTTTCSSSTSSTLTITLVRPSSSPSNDNRTAPRPDGRPPGRRFFACDDDFYGLEDSVAAGVLTSLSLSPSPPSRESLSPSSPSLGAAVRAPPWRRDAAAADAGRPRRVRDAACLPLGARRQLEAMLQEDEEGVGESDSDDSDSDEDGF